MKKLSLLTIFGGLLLFGASCTMQNKTIAGSPINTQVNFTSADLEYIGEVTGTATQSYVLGVPYGGRRYYTASTSGTLIPSFDRAFNNALYDALMQKPDADFVLPLSSESTTNQQFLGRKVTLKVRAKAYKIKTK